MDWSWTVVAAVLITYVHLFNRIATNYLDSIRTLAWKDIVHTWVPPFELTLKV